MDSLCASKVLQLKNTVKDVILKQCKQSLSYQCTLTVEGLLGITIDSDQVVLVNINNTLEPQNYESSISQERNQEQVVGTEMANYMEKEINSRNERSASYSHCHKVKKKNEKKRLNGTAEQHPSMEHHTVHQEIQNNFVIFEDKLNNGENLSCFENKDHVDSLSISDEDRVSDEQLNVQKKLSNIEVNVRNKAKTECATISCENVNDDNVENLKSANKTTNGNSCCEGNTDSCSEGMDNVQAVQLNAAQIKARKFWGKNSKVKELQRRHIKSVTLDNGQLQHQCDVCLKTFSILSNARRHLVVHGISERPYACHLCDLRFDTQRRLNDHMEFKHKGKRIICELCDKMFQTQYTYSRHGCLQEEKKGEKEAKKDKTKKSKDSFVCEDCGKVYTKKDALDYHYNSVHVKKIVKCNYCGKSYPYRSNLKKHLNSCPSRLASPDAKVTCYPCNKCGNIFYEKNHLDEHTKHMHMDQKFICSKCGKVIRWKGSFKNHVQKCNGDLKSDTTGEKPHTVLYKSTDTQNMETSSTHSVHQGGIGSSSDMQNGGNKPESLPSSYSVDAIRQANVITSEQQSIPSMFCTDINNVLEVSSNLLATNNTSPFSMLPHPHVSSESNSASIAHCSSQNQLHSLTPFIPGILTSSDHTQSVLSLPNDMQLLTAQLNLQGLSAAVNGQPSEAGFSSSLEQNGEQIASLSLTVQNSACRFNGLPTPRT